MDDLVLIPYIQIDGSWTIPDEAMVNLFLLSEQEGTAETVFYAAGVNDGEDFIKLLRQPGTYPIVILDNEGPPVAVVWIKDFARNYAFGHFLFFKNSWGNGKSVAAGKLACDHFFHFNRPDGSPMLDVLLGIMSAENPRSTIFVEKVGFTVVGRIPKTLYNHYHNRKEDAVLAYIERKVQGDG